MKPLFLCRYGELFLKLGNRSRFEKQLRDNMHRLLKGVPGARIEPVHGRILVWAEDPQSAPEIAARLGRIFGLVSFSPAVAVAPELDAINAAAIACTQKAVAADPSRARSFRVAPRRSNKHFPLRSLEIGRDVGAAVFTATGIPVDLHNPALVVGVEVGHKYAYVYAETVDAPGGLPLGTAGKGLLLLSGGIDSPVAGWHAAKRGLTMDAVYFHSPPFTGEKSKDKVIALGKVLAGWGALNNLYVVGFTEAQKRLRAAGPGRLAVVLYRRMMIRVADALADQTKAAVLLTGESLGQVASQTLTNMSVIDQAAKHLVMRPLVTNDKQETINIAQKIGTMELSNEPYDDCCSLFVPAHPATAARLRDVQHIESRMDLDAEVKAMVDAAECINLRV